MWSDAKHNSQLVRLGVQLQGVAAVTPKLVLEVIAQACPRLSGSRCPEGISEIHRLIEAKAWTDLTLMLVSLELPQWKLRRLVYEDGGWFCSLSKHWQVPDWLDDAVEAHHEVLPIAILIAFTEAQRNAMNLAETNPPIVPQVQTGSLEVSYPVNCDDFC
jgi:hypothetical protein